MTDPATNLQNLRDIVVPEAPPLWPTAPGVWVLVIVVLALALVLILWWRRARAANAYRHVGLALLADARTSRDVNVILKRVALAAFPRPRVASLYGDDWAAFLDRTCPRARFASIVWADPHAEISPELRTQAGVWIRHHRTPPGGVQEGEA